MCTQQCSLLTTQLPTNQPSDDSENQPVFHLLSYSCETTFYIPVALQNVNKSLKVRHIPLKYEGWSKGSWTGAVKFMSLNHCRWFFSMAILTHNKFNKYFKFRCELLRNKINMNFYKIRGIATRRRPPVSLDIQNVMDIS